MRRSGHEVLVPWLQAGRRLLVVSHGNTLRGLVMHLTGLSPRGNGAGGGDSFRVPLVHRFASDFSVTGHEWLEVPIPHRAGT